MDPFQEPSWSAAIEVIARERKSNDPVLAFPAGSGVTNGFSYYSAKDILSLAAQAAASYARQGIKPRSKGDRALIVALYGYGTIEWVASCFAVARMGHTVLALSSRLSLDYVSGLLSSSKTDVLIHDAPHPTESISMPAQVKVMTMASFQGEIQGDQLISTKQFICDASVIDPDDLAFITHSSGSTSIPKLLPHTHTTAMSRYRASRAFSPPITKIWLATAVYNAAGFLVMAACLDRWQPAFFEDDTTMFTSSSVCDFWQASGVTDVRLTPYTLGLLASTDEGMTLLKSATSIDYFGAVLPDDLGNRLVGAGIDISTTYAMTETALLMTSKGRPHDDNDWQWMTLMPYKAQHLELRPTGGRAEYGGEVYELVCSPSCPEILESVRSEDGCFYTKDLFLAHPTKQGRWKLIGRKDDQIKIYQGDRQVIINALVYEAAIMDGLENIIDEVVLFGIGRGKLGVLVFAEGAAQGSEKRQVVAESVWQNIQDHINRVLRVGIEQSMIVVLDVPRSTLPRTTKLNFIRAQLYDKYRTVIEQAYEPKRVQNDSQMVNGGDSTSFRPSI